MNRNNADINMLVLKKYIFNALLSSFNCHSIDTFTNSSDPFLSFPSGLRITMENFSVSYNFAYNNNFQALPLLF